MNRRHNEIAPLNTSFVNSTRFPCPYGNGGGENGGMHRPRRRPLPPLLPYPQTPLTGPPMGLPMYQPSPPVFSSGSLPPMSPAPSWLPYYQPAPVANYTPALTPLPFTWPATSADSSSSLPGRKAHGRGNSENVSGSSSLRMIYPKPVEIPVGVEPEGAPGEKESHEEATDVTDVSLTDYMDPDKIYDVFNEDDLEIILGDLEKGESSGGENIDSNLNGHESPNLPPSPGNHQGVTNSVDDGNDNAFKIHKGVFPASSRRSKNYVHTAVGIRDISLCDSKHAKRILANRESSARSNANKTRRINELEEKVRALERKADVLTAKSKLKDRSLSALEDENKHLRLHANGLQKELSRCNVLIEQLTGEDPRLKLATCEVNHSENDMSNWDPLDANMFQAFDLDLDQLDQQPQTGFGFNEQII